jgi:hypothetical protein
MASVGVRRVGTELRCAVGGGNGWDFGGQKLQAEPEAGRPSASKCYKRAWPWIHAGSPLSAATDAACFKQELKAARCESRSGEANTAKAMSSGRSWSWRWMDLHRWFAPRQGAGGLMEQIHIPVETGRLPEHWPLPAA